jgi:hypothetical protein
MAHVVEKNDVRAVTDEAWLRDAKSSFDAGSALTIALAPAWTADREIDPSGEVSIVVLPTLDTASRPTFVLYEEDGLVQVSTFHGEDWQRRQSFRTCLRAVAAIVAAAQAMSDAAAQASSTSRTTRARSSVL